MEGPDGSGRSPRTGGAGGASRQNSGSSTRGLPAVLSEWYTTAFEVYAETALGLAGAKNISLVLEPAPTGKHASGIELVTLRGDAHWD